MTVKLPEDFSFGTSTAAYQIEGAWDADGKGESIWDRFSHTPGKVKNGDSGDVACDHYRRFETDLDLAAGANMRIYRFSIAWTRLFPQGTGWSTPAWRAGSSRGRASIIGTIRRRCRTAAAGPTATASSGMWTMPPRRPKHSRTVAASS